VKERVVAGGLASHKNAPLSFSKDPNPKGRKKKAKKPSVTGGESSEDKCNQYGQRSLIRFDEKLNLPTWVASTSRGRLRIGVRNCPVGYFAKKRNKTLGLSE